MLKTNAYFCKKKLTESTIEKTDLSVSILDPHNPESVNRWKDLINESYAEYHETEYDFQSAYDILTHHPYIMNPTIVGIYDEGLIVGSVIIGVFRKNPDVGTIARLAVRPSHQKNGIGKYLIQYSCNYLFTEYNVKFVESLVSSKRFGSLYTHYGAGFIPQTRARKIVAQFALENINPIQFLRLKRRANLTYKNYLNKHKH